MAASEVLMQDVDCEVNTGTPSVPVWTRIAGVTDVTHSPSTTRVDTHNFDSDGRMAHRVVRRGDTFSITAMRYEDPANGNRDAGQNAVETSSREVGADAEKGYRLTSPGGETITFDATAQVTILGGTTDAVATWAAELVVTGDITFA